MGKKRRIGKVWYLLLCLFLCAAFFAGGVRWMQNRISEEHVAVIEELSRLTDQYSLLTEERAALNDEHLKLIDNYLVLLTRCLEARGHGMGTVQNHTFTESAIELKNPNRGFYHMNGFYIRDEETDFHPDVARRFAWDRSCSLTMVEINLKEFRKGDITEKGLASMEDLFKALANTEKQMIVRFLYDWDGRNMASEPDRIDTILRHMEQVSPLLKQYGDQIFLLQGLFIGNVGEMNGSKYLEPEDMQKLAGKLYEIADENAYLAVRTPEQWRKITEIADPGLVVRGDGSLTSRLGLYNDGMLGSWTDYGTYGADTSQEKNGPYVRWNRQEEIAFQNVLCGSVPNGGEVIIDNEYNDFENALADMRAMHITYLNRDYDEAVFDKWKETIVHEEGCFDGMDGLNYMERHLGYRFVLRDAALDYDWEADRLTAAVTIQNVGFAPIYRETRAKITLYDRDSGREYRYDMDSIPDIRSLSGGDQAEEQITLSGEVPVGGQPGGVLEVYFALYDILAGEMIYFGNEQEPCEMGYCIGTLELGEPEELWETWNETGK